MVVSDAKRRFRNSPGLTKFLCVTQRRASETLMPIANIPPPAGSAPVRVQNLNGPLFRTTWTALIPEAGEAAAVADVDNSAGIAVPGDVSLNAF